MKTIYVIRLKKPLGFGRFRDIKPIDLLMAGGTITKEFINYLKWLEENTNVDIDKRIYQLQIKKIMSKPRNNKGLFNKSILNI